MIYITGFDNKLTDSEELYDIPTEFRCSYVGAKLDKALIGNVDQYQQYAEIPHEPFIGSGKNHLHIKPCNKSSFNFY